jgi:hypothetical protein
MQLRAGAHARRLPVHLVWKIHEGHYGETDLSGLGVVALGEFTGNMWVGDPNAMMSLMF